MFKKVCIIGCGLIGSSIARVIRKQNLSAKIVSSNRSDSVNKKVIELKIVDDSNSDTKKMAEGSDLIIIATPLSSYENVILKIKDSLKNGSILTDVGSVKENVIILIEKNVPKNVSWISSHPIAGTEESGPEAGFSELFENRWCILTPSKKTNEPAANFFLMNFDETRINSDEVFEKLAAEKLILRKMTQYKISNALRLTIGNKEVNEHFIKSVGSILK